MVDCNHKVSLIKLRELDFFASGNLGVDYETMNPTAKIFWRKNFNPYTVSMVRRLDS